MSAAFYTDYITSLIFFNNYFEASSKINIDSVNFILIIYRILFFVAST